MKKIITAINNPIINEKLKKEKIEVNSYHKQAIKDVAPGFKVIARCEDGTIEGIEKENIVGVQWHPEYVFDMKLFS